MTHMLVLCLGLMLTIAPALGALPASLPVDSGSLDALLSGEDVCGDADNRNACLRVMPCEDVDPLLSCSEAEPVWRADPALGGKGGREALFRRVLPVPAGPHPNTNSLADARGRVVGSAAYFVLPSAAALYDKPLVTKPHPEHCSARFCTIPAALYFVNEAGIAFPSCKFKVSSSSQSLTRTTSSRRAGRAQPGPEPLSPG